MAEIKYRRMRIVDMQPAEHNPRKDLQPGDPEWDKIQHSLKTFGMLEPVVFNKRTGRIVGGHQRVKILQSQGETEVDVSLVDLSDEDEKILCALLNRAQGYWDTTKLADLLGEIKEKTGTLQNTGFEEWEYESLIREYDHIGDLLEEDFTDLLINDPDTFTVTFTFPAGKREAIDRYMAEHGRNSLRDNVVIYITRGGE